MKRLSMHKYLEHDDSMTNRLCQRVKVGDPNDPANFISAIRIKSWNPDNYWVQSGSNPEIRTKIQFLALLKINMLCNGPFIGRGIIIVNPAKRGFVSYLVFTVFIYTVFSSNWQCVFVTFWLKFSGSSSKETALADFQKNLPSWVAESRRSCGWWDEANFDASSVQKKLPSREK
jgi:hypothetical protein